MANTYNIDFDHMPDRWDWKEEHYGAPKAEIAKLQEEFLQKYDYLTDNEYDIFISNYAFTREMKAITFHNVEDLETILPLVSNPPPPHQQFCDCSQFSLKDIICNHSEEDNEESDNELEHQDESDDESVPDLVSDIEDSDATDSDIPDLVSCSESEPEDDEPKSEDEFESEDKSHGEEELKTQYRGFIISSDHPKDFNMVDMFCSKMGMGINSFDNMKIIDGYTLKDEEVPPNTLVCYCDGIICSCNCECPCACLCFCKGDDKEESQFKIPVITGITRHEAERYLDECLSSPHLMKRCEENYNAGKLDAIDKMGIEVLAGYFYLIINDYLKYLEGGVPITTKIQVYKDMCNKFIKYKALVTTPYFSAFNKIMQSFARLNLNSANNYGSIYGWVVFAKFYPDMVTPTCYPFINKIVPSYAKYNDAQDFDNDLFKDEYKKYCDIYGVFENGNHVDFNYISKH
jgi:hypothetical protein